MLPEILQAFSSAMDWPGRQLRWGLSGFSNDERDYESGRGLLEHYGLLGRNTNGLDLGDIVGFGAEQVLDPLNFLTGAGLLKGAKVVGRGLGMLDEASDFSRLANAANEAGDFKRMFSQAENAVQPEWYQDAHRTFMQQFADETRQADEAAEWFDPLPDAINHTDYLGPEDLMDVGVPNQMTGTGFYSKSMRALENLPPTKPQSIFNAVLKGGGSKSELDYIFGPNPFAKSGFPADAKGRIDPQELIHSLRELGYDWTENLRVVGGEGRYLPYMPGPVSPDDLYKELLLVENNPWASMLDEADIWGKANAIRPESESLYSYSGFPLNAFRHEYMPGLARERLFSQMPSSIEGVLKAFKDSKAHFTESMGTAHGLGSGDLVLGHARYGVYPGERLLLGELQSDVFQNAREAFHPLQKDDKWKRALMGSVLREASMDDVNRILLASPQDVSSAVGLPIHEAVDLYEKSLPRVLEGFGKPYGASVERMDHGLLGMRLPPSMKAALLSQGIALPAILAMLRGDQDAA